MYRIALIWQENGSSKWEKKLTSGCASGVRSRGAESASEAGHQVVSPAEDSA